jgi:hypothetical protein
MSQKTIFQPTNCASCPLGEIERFTVFCRHYKLFFAIDHDERPEYCKVERITIEEGGNDEKA